MDPIDFQPPAQQPADEHAFDTRPAAVRAWIEQLPLGNLSKTARELYRVLHQVNRQVVPVSQRLEMLEAMAPALHAVLASVQQHLAKLHPPLSQGNLGVGDYTRRLITELVIGYQNVLDGHHHGSWLFRLTHHALWPQSVHRMVHYLGCIARVQRLIHQPCPRGLWHALHRLYREAAEHQQGDTRIELPWDEARRETIKEAYIQVLLASQLDPSVFTPAQQALIYEELPGWAGLVGLHPVSAWQADMPAYWIRQDGDSPHTLPASQAKPEELDDAPHLLLELGRLHQAIGARLDAAERSQPGEPLTHSTLASLLLAWQVPTEAREPRTHGEAERYVAIGLSALYSLLHQEQRYHHPGITDQIFSSELQPLLPTPHTASGLAGPARKKPGTVWDSIFYSTEVGVNTWSMESDEVNYHFITAHEQDSSPHGYCLRLNSTQLQGLDVGELIGVRREPQGELELCEVRWIEQRDTLLLAGLHVLARQLEPILAIMHDTDNAIPLACLLAIGNDGHPQLFLPNLPGIAQRPFSLVVDHYQVPIELQRRMATSPLFTARHFELHPSFKVSKHLDENMNLDELNRRLHRITHGDLPNDEEEGGEFDDLWKNL